VSVFVSVFESGTPAPDASATIKQLHAKIGELAMENDFCASSQGWRIQQESVLPG
jgi:hypothetical protein